MRREMDWLLLKYWNVHPQKSAVYPLFYQLVCVTVADPAVENYGSSPLTKIRGLSSVPSYVVESTKLLCCGPGQYLDGWLKAGKQPVKNLINQSTRLTQPSTLHGMVKWVGLSVVRSEARADWFLRWLVGAQRWCCTYLMNWANFHNGIALAGWQHHKHCCGY